MRVADQLNIQEEAEELREFLSQASKLKTRTVFLTVKLEVDEDADTDEVISEMDYEFEHEKIKNTEVVEYFDNTLA